MSDKDKGVKPPKTLFSLGRGGPKGSAAQGADTGPSDATDDAPLEPAEVDAATEVEVEGDVDGEVEYEYVYLDDEGNELLDELDEEVEYEYVYVDDEGNEIPVEEADGAVAPSGEAPADVTGERPDADELAVVEESPIAVPPPPPAAVLYDDPTVVEPLPPQPEGRWEVATPVTGGLVDDDVAEAGAGTEDLAEGADTTVAMPVVDAPPVVPPTSLPGMPTTVLPQPAAAGGGGGGKGGIIAAVVAAVVILGGVAALALGGGGGDDNVAADRSTTTSKAPAGDDEPTTTKAGDDDSEKSTTTTEPDGEDDESTTTSAGESTTSTTLASTTSTTALTTTTTQAITTTTIAPVVSVASTTTLAPGRLSGGFTSGSVVLVAGGSPVSYTFTNTGGQAASLQVTTTNTNFTINGGGNTTLSVPPGGSVTVSVAARPGTPGSSAQITALGPGIGVQTLNAAVS